MGAHLCELGTDDCVKITTAELEDNMILGLPPETWVVWWVPRSWGPQGGGQTKVRTEQHSSATPTPRHWTAITRARSSRTGSVVFSSSSLADRMHSRKILIQAFIHERRLPRKSTSLEYVTFPRGEVANGAGFCLGETCWHLLFQQQLRNLCLIENRYCLLYCKILRK